MRGEDQIQTTLAQHLWARGHSDLLWWHTPNEGKRSARSGAALKRMGMLPGVSDIVAVHGGEIFALELKRPKKNPSETQLEFIERMRTAGGHALVAQGLDEAVACLEAWGLLRGRTV